MISGALVWLRWAQFVDLALVFGVPLTAGLMGERRLGGAWRVVLGMAGAAGLGVGGLCFLVMLCAMTGGTMDDLDRDTMVLMLCHSALGWSVLIRLGVLTICLMLTLSCRQMPTGALVGLSTVAVASLAWGGHGAASQGAAGTLRLAGDMAHLWAGLGWLGALMLFTARLWQKGDQTLLARALGRFALIGSVLVGILVLSGLGNLLFLAGPAQWVPMSRTPYGQLLTTKLALFAGMFLLAAHNRFHLVPALECAVEPTAQRGALLALRRSVSLETLLALGVIWCVSFAGTLDPAGG